jgi:hypothetical protein
MGQTFTQPNSALISPDGSIAIAPPQHIMQEATRRAQDAGTDQAKLDKLPKIGTPSIQQAVNTGPAGTPNAASPGLSKAGKLVTLLTSGLQGALAGRAAQEQMIAQTGGHRAGGVGTGFEAGLKAPFLRASMPLGLEQQQAETQLAQAGTQPIETQYGNMPAALASKILTPYLGYQGKVESSRIGAQGREQAAQTGAQARVESAQIARKYVAVPNVGLFDTEKRQVVPGTQQGIVVTPDIAEQYQLPQDFIGKPMSLQNLSSLEGAGARNVSTVMGAGGPALVTKTGPNAGKTTQLGLGVPSLGGSQEIGDPDNPGETKFTTKANAIKTGASGPQSASVQVPKTAAKAEVPTKIGDQKVAFQTMIDHAGLLRTAAKALHNGDSQTLAGLKNRFQNEFGYAGPITAEAIADAYKGEVSNVINKGHITDTGNEKIAHTLDPRAQNYATLDSVLGAYQSLAQSKMNQLNRQKQSAISGSQPQKPNAPTKRRVIDLTQ